MKKLMLLGGIRYPLPVIKAFPTENQIRYTLCIKLSWSHLRLIMRVGDPQARKYYLEEASRCGWGVRDLNDEIQKMSFDRVRARQVEVVDNPCDRSPEITPYLLLKDPCVAEFLNLGRKLHGKEKKVEQRIIDNIEQFMLELGKGFTFAGRQVRVPTETSEKYVDLVFYNYLMMKKSAKKFIIRHMSIMSSRGATSIHCLRTSHRTSMGGGVAQLPSILASAS